MQLARQPLPDRLFPKDAARPRASHARPWSGANRSGASSISLIAELLQRAMASQRKAAVIRYGTPPNANDMTRTKATPESEPEARAKRGTKTGRARVARRKAWGLMRPNAFLQRTKHAGAPVALARGVTACLGPTARIC